MSMSDFVPRPMIAGSLRPAPPETTESPVAVALKQTLRGMLEGPLTAGVCGKLAKTAMAAVKLLQAVDGGLENFQIGPKLSVGGSMLTGGAGIDDWVSPQYEGPSLYNSPLSTSSKSETIGNTVMRELIALLPKAVEAYTAKTPAQLVGAIAEAKAAGLDDVAASIRAQLDKMVQVGPSTRPERSSSRSCRRAGCSCSTPCRSCSSVRGHEVTDKSGATWRAGGTPLSPGEVVPGPDGLVAAEILRATGDSAFASQVAKGGGGVWTPPETPSSLDFSDPDHPMARPFTRTAPDGPFVRADPNKKEPACPGCRSDMPEPCPLHSTYAKKEASS